jgi:hypothetical protein
VRGRNIGISVIALTVISNADALGQSGDYNAYRKEVDRLSNQNYNQNKSTIDPDGLRGRKNSYDLDHQNSVKCGYSAGLPPAVVASPENLRVMPSAQNRSEGSRGC